MNNSKNSLFEAALAYAEQGLYIFPVRPNRKEPLIAGGFKNASNQITQIKEWWSKWPDANIGLVTGKINNLFVVDVDGVYPEDFPVLDYHPKVKTSKGYHVYFEHPMDREIKSRTRINGSEVDIRGENAYIIVPPSIHPTGVKYEFMS